MEELRLKGQTRADGDSSFPGSGSGEDMFVDSVDRPQAQDTTGVWAERQDPGLVRLHIFVYCQNFTEGNTVFLKRALIQVWFFSLIKSV